MNERYCVDLIGEVKESLPKEQVIARLADLFQCDAARIARLFDGKRHALKSDLGWKAARQYQKAIHRTGAKCKLRVVMDRKAFENALFSVDSPTARAAAAEARNTGASQPAASTQKTQPAKILYHFDTARIIPKIFYPPSGAMVFEQKTVVGNIKSLKATLSFTAALLAAVAIGLFLERIFATYYAEHISAGMSATVLSIVLLLLVVVFLPNLMRPLRKFHIELAHNGKKSEIMLRQSRGIWPAPRKFAVETLEGERLVEMRKSHVRHRFVCFDRNGGILLRAEEEPDIDELFLEAAGDIRSELVDLPIVEHARTVWEMLKHVVQVKKKVKKEGKGALVSSLRDTVLAGNETVFVMRDQAGKAVGHIVSGRICRFIFYANEIKTRDIRILFAFGLVVAGI